MNPINKSNYYCVREYQAFPEKFTPALLELGQFDLVKLSAKGGKVVFTAQNYVGTISLKRWNGH
ncbi:hypothetical protein P261_00580 [Lachnospiraceae bacterium TWA4]|nr:hypothetical protein P261_00580 [Lachnospiraceae bacterium TWA4]